MLALYSPLPLPLIYFFKCTLCMGKDGALKRTVDGDWVHIICMQWIPEISNIAGLFLSFLL